MRETATTFKLNFSDIPGEVEIYLPMIMITDHFSYEEPPNHPRTTECAVHGASVSALDLSYEVGRVIFAEWPQLVIVYVNELAQAYSVKWDLPETIKAVGITGSCLMDLRSLRVNATLGMLDFVAQGPHISGAASSLKICMPC